MGSPGWIEFDWHNRGIGVGLMIAFWPFTYGNDSRGYCKRQTCQITMNLLICTLQLNIPLWR